MTHDPHDWPATAGRTAFRARRGWSLGAALARLALWGLSLAALMALAWCAR